MSCIQRHRASGSVRAGSRARSSGWRVCSSPAAQRATAVAQSALAAAPAGTRCCSPSPSRSPGTSDASAACRWELRARESLLLCCCRQFLLLDTRNGPPFAPETDTLRYRHFKPFKSDQNLTVIPEFRDPKSS